MNDFEEEDFDQEEFKRIASLAQKETQQAIQRIVAANKDNRTKAVGDQIIVWDGSRLTDFETGEIDYDVKTHSILGNYPSIVIDTDRKYTAQLKTFAGDFSRNLDLVIWNKNLNKKYRTSSDFVKLYEPQYT